MEKSAKQPKRSLFCFDFSAPWADALKEMQKTYYRDELSPTALVRHIVQDFVSCHYDEETMKKRELLASYKHKPDPELLLHAVRFNEKMKKGR